jgi:homoserine O-succinyltransferase
MAEGFSLPDGGRLPQVDRRHGGAMRPLVIGLVNNMPDAALAATEGQFKALIARAGGERDIRLKLFSLPGVARGIAAREAMARRYMSTDSLPASSVDALIVTGAEPLAPDLADEPYWRELAALTDWAERHTVSTLFSCLAAHAAVQHLSEVRRTPLPEKCSGVFEVEARPHALTAGQGRMLVPHSRLNGLSEPSLTRHGYQVLSASAAIGVDAFVRERNSLFLFLQGHPEYDAESLMLEYRRDVRRFLMGERASHPAIPTGYFDPDVDARLSALAEETIARPQLSALSECARIMRDDPPTARWAKTTIQLYRNWIDLIAQRVGAKASAC